MANIDLIRCIAKPSMAWKDIICLAIYELMYSKCHIMPIAWKMHQVEGGHPSSQSSSSSPSLSSIHDECTTTKYSYSTGLHHLSNAYGSHHSLNDIQGIVPMCEPSSSSSSSSPSLDPNGPSFTKPPPGSDEASAPPRSPHHAHCRSPSNDKGPSGWTKFGSYSELLEDDWVDVNETESEHWVSVSDDDDDNEEEESENDWNMDTHDGNKPDTNWTFFTRSHRRKFPPPLDTLCSRHEENTHHAPYGCGTTSATAYCLRSFRMEGRFVLREARAPTYEYLKVSRKDGCLKVDLMNPTHN